MPACWSGAAWSVLSNLLAHVVKGKVVLVLAVAAVVAVASVAQDD